MGLRIALGMAGFAITMSLALAARQPAWAQTPAPATPPAATTPATPPAATAPAAEPFGEETTLTAKPIIFVKGTGSWDKAFDTIVAAFRKLKAYTDKEGLKPDGLPMTVFTSTDDSGFTYQAALALSEPLKNAPHGDIGIGQSPDGRALKFVHHGSYEDLDNTYEAITNYLDDKRLEAKDLFIEEYVTDPVTADPKKLVVNVYVLLK